MSNVNFRFTSVDRADRSNQMEGKFHKKIGFYAQQPTFYFRKGLLCDFLQAWQQQLQPEEQSIVIQNTATKIILITFGL